MFSLPSDILSEVEVSGSHGSSIFLIFEDLPYCLPGWNSIISTTSVQRFPFLHTHSPTPIISCLSDDRHGNRSEMLSHCDFGLFP